MNEVQLQEDAWGDVDEGTEALLDEWHVAVGDKVTAGQLLATVIVAKTKYEVVSPVSGTVSELRFAAQDSFARGQAIATVQGRGDEHERA